MAERRDSMGGDVAPHSRLFIIGSKELGEDDVRDAFKEYGSVKQVKVVKDRMTRENKGIFYVKYTKTSAAAKALEEMKGKVLRNRSLKVMIASNREEGSVRDENEERIKRLFIVVPKSATDNEVYDYFKQFGGIEYASILKNRETKESKGFAYVKFTKFSAAAEAFENCDRKYKPKFAEPKKLREDPSKNSVNKSDIPQSTYNRMSFSDNNFSATPNFRGDGFYKLSVVASPVVNQDQMWKLFDIVPSLDYCQNSFDCGNNRSRIPTAAYEVVYRNSEWANYAINKFHGFEYPPGHRLIVKMDNEQIPSLLGSNSASVKRPATSSIDFSGKPDLLQLAETIAQATSLIKAAGLIPELLQSKLSSSSVSNDSKDYSCNVDLPALQPMAHVDSPCEARCFIICFPKVLPPHTLRDIFCRFGDLIEVYLLNNKSCGYAKYASQESAEAAIKTLHGAEVCGSRLKVFEAEAKPDKRLKMEESNKSSSDD